MHIAHELREGGFAGIVMPVCLDCRTEVRGVRNVVDGGRVATAAYARSGVVERVYQRGDDGLVCRRCYVARIPPVYAGAASVRCTDGLVCVDCHQRAATGQPQQGPRQRLDLRHLPCP
jgi:hypothetical protein